MDGSDQARLYREQMGEEAAKRQEALAYAMKHQTCACEHLPGAKPTHPDAHKLGCPRGAPPATMPRGSRG